MGGARLLQCMLHIQWMVSKFLRFTFSTSIYWLTNGKMKLFVIYQNWTTIASLLRLNSFLIEVYSIMITKFGRCSNYRCIYHSCWWWRRRRRGQLHHHCSGSEHSLWSGHTHTHLHHCFYYHPNSASAKVKLLWLDPSSLILSASKYLAWLD